MTTTDGGLDAHSGLQQADAILAEMVDEVVAEAEKAAAGGPSAGAQGDPTLPATRQQHSGFGSGEAIVTRSPGNMRHHVDETDPNTHRPDPMTTKVRSVCSGSQDQKGGVGCEVHCLVHCRWALPWVRSGELRGEPTTLTQPDQSPTLSRATCNDAAANIPSEGCQS